jgi:mono/diheme cytochrome c family protein
MKARNIIIAITGIAFIALVSCSRRHSEPITGKTVDITNSQVRNGQILYNRYCQKCHPAGEAGLGPEVTGKPGFARKFQVRHGLGVMPYFKKGLINKKELDDMMVYLNHLKRLK